MPLPLTIFNEEKEKKMTLLKKLEAIKQQGNYAVTLYYGEDIGCDDSDIKPRDRHIKVVCHPVGYLGELRTIYSGTVKSLLKFDVTEQPKILSNPPKREDYREEGFYVFGTDDAIESLKKKGGL